ncbi:MAG: radical SAM protein [Syntrophus sp. (in: bacteria)]
MIIKEILAKSILTKSKIYDYTINPYIGCSHSCVYCYAAFMKRVTGHRENWGDFVDIKVNASDLLAKEITKKPIGRVWISGVCDPFQPLEEQYKLTRKCLELLVTKGWPVTIQTKSPLILRDIDILEKSTDMKVIFSIATVDEKIRKIFEPGAPPIQDRINALQILHSRGIKTIAMIAPILPGASRLVEDLEDKVDHVFIDRVNYNYANRLYREYGMEWAKETSFFAKESNVLKSGFDRLGVSSEIIF